MKQDVRGYLERQQFDAIADAAGKKKRIMGVLVSLTYDANPVIAWRAVEAMGSAAERVAESNPEFVRGHLRRLHWLLSEESGGICRHAPQAMAEIVRRNPELFSDYTPIVASLLVDMAEEDLASGFRPAVLWAIGRLGSEAADHIEAVVPAVAKCLDDPDPQVRGMAVWCLVQTGNERILTDKANLQSDDGPVDLYEDGQIHRTCVRELVQRTAT